MTDQLLFPGIEATRPLTDSLFFAIVPDALARASIETVTQDLRDKYALTGKSLAERLHVSLHGLGEYPSFPDGIAARAIEAAASVAMAPFEVMFDRAMSFSGKAGQLPLVLVGDGTDGVVALQQALGGALAKAGLAARRSTPHLTLLYDVRRVDEQPVVPIGWTVRQFVLVHSLLGRGVYKSLGRWPLRG
jgi:2'-5' RNA ligase